MTTLFSWSSEKKKEGREGESEVRERQEGRQEGREAGRPGGRQEGRNKTISTISSSFIWGSSQEMNRGTHCRARSNSQAFCRTAVHLFLSGIQVLKCLTPVGHGDTSDRTLAYKCRHMHPVLVHFCPGCMSEINQPQLFCLQFFPEQAFLRILALCFWASQI